MKHISMILPFLVLLLTVSVSQAMDPPEKLWEKWYYQSWYSAEFHDIELNQDGNLFITGLIYDYTPQLALENYVALLVDPDGNVLWEIPHEFDGAFGYDGVILEDGSYVITGVANDMSSSSISALYIHKISPDGNTLWAKLYDYPNTKEEGYGITCLPDGGFAVCGRVHGTGTWAGEAWILRTDSNGDTLWTETWGTSIENYGKSVLFNNDEITVLTRGEDDTLVTQGPHLLFYDLDGNYLRGSDYPELNYIFPGDICPASDGGYIFVTKTFPSIAHTDSYGELLWRYSIESNPNDENEGHCIRQTMDGGYIFSGWDGYFEYEPDIDDDLSHARILTDYTQESNTVDYKEGWLVKFDSEGNEQWNMNNLVSHDDFFYSVVQLPEGGYITGGTWTGTGYLVRYAPETGIELEEPSPVVTLEVSPNPFTESLSVNFSLPEEMNVTLRIYDLTGRIIDTVTQGSFSEGVNTVQWVPSDNLYSGCYLVQVDTPIGLYNQACVLLY